MGAESQYFLQKDTCEKLNEMHKSFAKELTKNPIHRPLPMGCAVPHNAGPPCLLVHFVLENYRLAHQTFVQANLVDEGHIFARQNDVSHRVDSNTVCSNDLFAILHFTGLAKELCQPGAQTVAMDNACLACPKYVSWCVKWNGNKKMKLPAWRKTTFVKAVCSTR